jgi:steroid 5-alpha reductase family enzyme
MCVSHQQVLCFIISQPLFVAIRTPSTQHVTMLDVLATATWSVGFVFEAVGDYQLACFKADRRNQGKLLNTGLWRFTRHPNYFGNAVMFWAFFMFALNADGGWWSVYAPVLMNFLLVRVSGVALLEKGMAKSNKPGYDEYLRTTNAFIPWFPASSK